MRSAVSVMHVHNINALDGAGPKREQSLLSNLQFVCNFARIRYECSVKTKHEHINKVMIVCIDNSISTLEKLPSIEVGPTAFA